MIILKTTVVIYSSLVQTVIIIIEKYRFSLILLGFSPNTIFISNNGFVSDTGQSFKSCVTHMTNSLLLLCLNSHDIERYATKQEFIQFVSELWNDWPFAYLLNILWSLCDGRQIWLSSITFKTCVSLIVCQQLMYVNHALFYMKREVKDKKNEGQNLCQCLNWPKQANCVFVTLCDYGHFRSLSIVTYLIRYINVIYFAWHFEWV